MDLCPEHRRLAQIVESVLAKLADLTQTHLRMFQEGDYVGSKRIDRELELTVGEKERAIGALRQHLTEHKCHGIEMP